MADQAAEMCGPRAEAGIVRATFLAGAATVLGGATGARTFGVSLRQTQAPLAMPIDEADDAEDGQTAAAVRGAQLGALALARTETPRLELSELAGTPSFGRPEVIVVCHGVSPRPRPGQVRDCTRWRVFRVQESRSRRRMRAIRSRTA